MMVIIAFFVMLGFVLAYGISLKSEVPFTETDEMKALSKKRCKKMLEAEFFGELAGDTVKVDTTWSDMYYKSVLKI